MSFGTLQLGHRGERKLVDIAREVELAAALELCCDGAAQAGFEDSSLAVSVLEPRIRKQHVKPVYRARTEDAVQIHVQVDVPKGEIAQSCLRRLLDVRFHQFLADFEAHHEPSWEAFSQLKRELSIGTTEFHVDLARPKVGRRVDAVRAGS